MSKLAVGILGCGTIAQNAYLPSFRNRYAAHVDVVACADIMPESARKCAETFSISRILSPDELLSDPAVELIVNLTLPEVHYELNKRALEAGKHVYCEKPLALSSAEALELRNIARKNSLMLSCAPDTLLGSSWQTARRALDSGCLGEIRQSAAWCSLNIGSRRYYRPAVGPILDFGPYYVAALIGMLGPVSRISALGSIVQLPNPDLPGETFLPETPSHAAVAFEFSSGVTGALAISTDSLMYESSIEVIGTKGRLSMADPNHFGGKAIFRDYAKGTQELEISHELDGQDRGAGVADMAVAIRENRPHRLSADFVVHTTEILSGILESIRTKQTVDLTTSCERPAPMSAKSSANIFALPST